MPDTLCIAYARFSPRPDAAESESNEAQFLRCEEYAAAHPGYKIVGKLCDEALTGMDDEGNPDPLAAIRKRPGLCQVLEEMKPGMVLLVRWRSRISREPFILNFVERLLACKGCRVESTDESNAQGIGPELERSVMSVVNKYKVLEIRWNTSRAMKRHQYTEHRRMGRADRTPFGYAPDPADPRFLVSVPEEQKAIAIIRAKAASGLGARRIAKYLDEHGISRRGKTWTSCHCLVGTILKRLEAAGK